MNEVKRTEILLDTYHQMISPVTEIAKMFKEHAAEARTHQRKELLTTLKKQQRYGLSRFSTFIWEDATDEWLRRIDCLNAIGEKNDSKRTNDCLS